MEYDDGKLANGIKINVVVLIKLFYKSKLHFLFISYLFSYRLRKLNN